MDRGTTVLQDFQRKLRVWEPSIKKATYADEVLFEPLAQGGEFRVVVRWKQKDGDQGVFVREFTRPFTFGCTYSLSPNAWSVEQRVCDHARGIIRDVLQLRGAL